MITVKRCILAFGIFITIIGGWVIPNADTYPFIYRIIAPKYSHSISALSHMQQKDSILEKGDVGFSEISEIIKNKYIGSSRKNIIPIITQIKVLNFRNTATLVKTAKGMEYSYNLYEVEISFFKGNPITGVLSSLDLEIKKMYLTDSVFQWRKGIFWTGIGISIVALFL